MSKSIALLVCDTPIGTVLDKHGDYQQIFTTLLRASLATDTEFKLDAFDVVHKQEYPSEEALDSYDAIMLTGSAASAYEVKEWIDKLVGYVNYVGTQKPKVKIIGICFGHQIVARALGGECVPNGGRWEVGVTPLELTDLGKEIFGVEELNIQEMHRDHVPDLPPNFHLLGSTAISMNQGMVRFSTTEKPPTLALEDINIFTVQGHPEFTESIVSAIVDVRAKSGVIDAKTAEEAIRRKDDRNDGCVIGKAIWKILGVQ